MDIRFCLGGHVTKTLPEAVKILSEFRKEGATFLYPSGLKAVLLQLLRSHFVADELLTGAEAFLQGFFDGNQLDVDLLSLSDVNRIYINKIAGLQRYATFLGKPPQDQSVCTFSLGSEDILATYIDEWSIYKVINFVLMLAIPHTRQIALVTSVRNEGLSILEWIAHHRTLGITDFFVYTNDNTDGSEALLDILASRGIIKLVRNAMASDNPIQTKVLEHSVQFLAELRDYEWVLFTDVDEFLVPRIGSDITDFFHELSKRFGRALPSAVCLHWKWYGSENCYTRTDGLLLQRFTHSIHNEHVKSMVRLRDIVSMRRVHVPILFPGCQAVTSDFKFFSCEEVGTTPTYEIAQLNHYWNKSFEEFVIKRDRGRISQSRDGHPLDFSSFFTWGSNGKKGNYDPPSEKMVRRTSDIYNQLLLLSGVAETMSHIREGFVQRLREIDESLDLHKIYGEYIRQ
jgi:hypothetical protein